jgi:predicted transcriptional regulator
MGARVSIRLRPAMLAALDRRARSCGRPRAAVIRDALTLYLAQPEAAARGRSTGSGTCWV